MLERAALTLHEHRPSWAEAAERWDEVLGNATETCTVGSLRVAGRRWTVFFHRNPEDGYEIVKKVREGGTWRGQVAWTDRDSKRRWQDITISPVLDLEDHVSNILAMIEDATERKEMQEQFAQAQKMEVIGRLAGGVAHDFNNMLAAIIAYSEMLTMESGLTGEHRDFVGEILLAGQQAAGLTRQLPTFARRQKVTPEPVELNELIKESLKLLGKTIGEDITIETELGDGLGTVTADRIQISQVIMNLCVNARDAMPDGGSIVIKTSRVELAGKEIPAGFTVVATSSAAEALEVISHDGDNIDILMTDIVMPGKSGPELVREARELGCRLPVVFMSGYSEHPSVDGMTVPEDAGFLEKPLSMRKLKTVLESMISS